MQALLVLLALLCVNPTPTYSVRATGKVQSNLKSCGASSRMLKDRHTVVVKDGGEFYVNGMRWWNVDNSVLPGEAYIAYHHGQKVWLTLWLMANDRKVIGLYALNGPGCQDIVRLEGYRK
jgi:hypothetical protein